MPIVACSVILVTACAHRDEAHLTMPSGTEIGEYVTERWIAGFSMRFSRFAGRPGQSSEVISIANARCESSFGCGIAECSYDVTAAFDGEEPVTRKLWSQFERSPNGALNEVLVIWHERKR